MCLQHRVSAGRLLEITASFEHFSRPFPVVPKLNVAGSIPVARFAGNTEDSRENPGFCWGFSFLVRSLPRATSTRPAARFRTVSCSNSWHKSWGPIGAVPGAPAPRRRHSRPIAAAHHSGRSTRCLVQGFRTISQLDVAWGVELPALHRPARAHGDRALPSLPPLHVPAPEVLGAGQLHSAFPSRAPTRRSRRGLRP